MDHVPSLALDESKEEAAKLLFEPSQLMLLSLQHSLPVSVIRRRLLAHIAGAPAPIHSPPHSPTNTPLSSHPVPSTSHLRYHYSNHHHPFQGNLSIARSADPSTSASWDAFHKRPIIAPLSRAPNRRN